MKNIFIFKLKDAEKIRGLIEIVKHGGKNESDIKEELALIFQISFNKNVTLDQIFIILKDRFKSDETQTAWSPNILIDELALVCKKLTKIE